MGYQGFQSMYVAVTHHQQDMHVILDGEPSEHGIIESDQAFDHTIEIQYDDNFVLDISHALWNMDSLSQYAFALTSYH